MTDGVVRLAQVGNTALSGLQRAGKTAGYGAASENSLPVLVGNVINAVLGLSGLALVILLVYGGILYLTAAGNEETVKKAKSVMRNAVIGIFIIASAYAVSVFVIDILLYQVTAPEFVGPPDSLQNVGPDESLRNPSPAIGAGVGGAAIGEALQP